MIWVYVCVYIHIHSKSGALAHIYVAGYCWYYGYKDDMGVYVCIYTHICIFETWQSWQMYVYEDIDDIMGLRLLLGVRMQDCGV